MQRTLRAVPVLLLLAACATARSDGSPQIQTTSEANRENLQGAAASPLRDVNVLQTKIPDVLIQAMEDPYARPSPTSCARIATLLLPLNGALGADLDEPRHDQDDLVNQGEGAVLGAVASVASSAIPFRGWVRKLSGAEAHDSLVGRAITAGAVRRAYLKGLGEAARCPPPATPLRSKAPPEPPPGKPKYPVR